MEQKTEMKFTTYQIFVVTILSILQFSIVLDFMIIAPLGDVLMKSLNIKPSQFSLIVSSYAFSAAIAGILTAGFADKFDRKKILLFFCSGFIIGTFLCGIATTYSTLLTARVVTGFFGGVVGSISFAIVTDMFMPNQRGRAMSFIQMAFAASQVLGIPLGVVLANKFSWHITFMMIVFLSLIILAITIVKLKPINEHLKTKSDKNPLLHLWHTIANRKYQTGFLAIALLSIGGFMLTPFISSFLINNTGVTQSELPLVFMLTGIFSMVAMPFIGRISDKFSQFKLFSAGSILAIVMTIIYTQLSVVPLWEVIVVNVLVMVGLMGRMVPAQSLNTLVPELTDRGAYMSITEALKQIAGGLGAVIAGLVVKQPTNSSPLLHFDTLGYLITGINLVSIFLVYRISVFVKKGDSTVPIHKTL